MATPKKTSDTKTTGETKTTVKSNGVSVSRVEKLEKRVRLQGDAISRLARGQIITEEDRAALEDLLTRDV